MISVLLILYVLITIIWVNIMDKVEKIWYHIGVYTLFFRIDVTSKTKYI